MRLCGIGAPARIVICSMLRARSGSELASGVNLKNSGSTTSGSTTAPRMMSGTAASQNQNHHFRGAFRITANKTHTSKIAIAISTPSPLAQSVSHDPHP